MKHKLRAAVASVVALAVTSFGATALAPPAHAAVAAFPGAEGFGTETTHGRGGQVLSVTNLNDSGTGSLRAALSASGPRIIVFKVSGTITLNSRIDVNNGNVYVAGQTAPGGGITIRNDPSNAKGAMLISAPDVLIRHVRFRPGKATSPGGSHDALTIYKPGAQRVVIDHASLSWSSDEVLNTYDDAKNITISNSIISEGLNDVGHSKGVLLGGSQAENVSFHHNLVATHNDRCPQVSGLSVADVRNNVLYNCGGQSGNGTTLLSSSKGLAKMNWVGNYYKRGPITPSGENDFATYAGDANETTGLGGGTTQQWYGTGNKRDYTGTVENAVVWSGVWGQVSTPFAAPPVTTTSAEVAYDSVLANAGANKPHRDAVDTRIVNSVVNRTGSVISDQATVGGYPTLPATSPPADNDNDGMADAWESANGVSSPTADADGDGYTNIEEYLSELAGDQGSNPPPPPTNQAPSVNAGSDSTVTLPNSANLDGTVSDDGLPSGSSVSQTWTKVSGPGTVTFGNANNVDTTASFSQSGTYVLRLTATDGTLSSNDEVTVTVNPQPPTNQAPVVNAGSDDSVTLPNGVSLDGTVSDDGLPNNNVTTTWSKVSGPGTVTFANASNVDTTATFSAAGTYVLRLTANDGALSSSDDVSVVVSEEPPPPPVNQAPSVDAGSDDTVTLPNDADLDGTVSDDGLPNNNVTTTWSKVSGPGTVTFGNAGNVDTTASFSAAGNYVLRLTADDGALSASDEVSVTVNEEPPPPPVNQAPNVNAGSDSTVTLPNGADLNGTVSDDGLPNNNVATTWTKVSGPGTVTFGNAGNVDTTATFSVDGTYVLRLTADDGALSNSDEVTVTVNAAPPPPVQLVYAENATTECDYLKVDYWIDDENTAPSEFRFYIDNVEFEYDQLVPPFYTFATATAVLEEDSSGGSIDVRVNADGNDILEFTKTTDCQQAPPAGVSFVGQGGQYSDTGGSVTVSPSGLNNGDVVLFYVTENKGSGKTISHPASVTTLGAEVDDGSSLGGRLYSHTKSASSPASFQFTSGASELQVSWVAYRGVGSVSQRALTADTNSDALHPVSGTTTASSVNVVFAADRIYTSNAPVSTWTLDSALTERRDAGGQKDDGDSSLSHGIGDTGTAVAAGSKTYSATASRSSSYGLTGLVQLSPLP